MRDRNEYVGGKNREQQQHQPPGSRAPEEWDHKAEAAEDLRNPDENDQKPRDWQRRRHDANVCIGEDEMKGASADKEGRQ